MRWPAHRGRGLRGAAFRVSARRGAHAASKLRARRRSPPPAPLRLMTGARARALRLAVFCDLSACGPSGHSAFKIGRCCEAQFCTIHGQCKRTINAQNYFTNGTGQNKRQSLIIKSQKHVYYFETLCLCHMSSARSTSDGRGPVTRKGFRIGNFSFNKLWKSPTYQSWIRMERFPKQRHPQDHQDSSPAL